MQDINNFLANHLMLTVAAALLMALLFIVELLRTKRGSFGLSATSATQMINHDNAIIIDIRPKETFQKGHIIDAQNLTANEILANPKKLEKYKTRPIIIVCGSGMESQKLTASLTQQGFKAYVLSGGIRAWTEAQMPLVKG